MFRRFIEQSWLCFKGQKSQFEFEEFLLLDTLYPFLSLVFYCVVASYSFGTSDVTHWVIGNAFLLCINTCIFSLGASFMGERAYGRIRSIIVSPASRLAVILEKGFFTGLETTLTVAVGFVAGCLLFHISFSGVPVGLLFLCVFISTIAATGFGLFLAVFGLITDEMHFILNMTNNVLVIFTGAEFPVEQLPRFCQVISGFLPMTRSIAAAEILFAGGTWQEINGLLAGEILLAVFYFVAGAGLIRLIERMALKGATLEVY